MNKQEFLLILGDRLVGIPEDERKRTLDYYAEIIDDRMEEGVTEAEAILSLGSVDAIVAQIIRDIPLAKIAKERIKPKRRLKAWEILLLALGSPIWLSLAVAACAVMLSVYVVLWSVIVSLWAVFISVAAAGLCGVCVGILYALCGRIFTGVALLGAGLVCGGLAIFLFLGCKAATVGAARLTKKIAFGIKKCFVKKEGA